MAFGGTRRFVGIGFGAIQAGLFLYEAYRSGEYTVPVVVDVRPELIEALRANAGHYGLNIARRDQIDAVQVGSVEIMNSTEGADRGRIIEAISRADEASTALPSVDTYRSGGEGSPHVLLAAGLARRRPERPLVIYCAENHNRAAALLEEAVLDATAPVDRDRVRAGARFADTVIGKMSGLITDPAELRTLGLAPMTPASPAAFLVEEFNHIQVSRACLDPRCAEALPPGIAALHPVDDLAPFAAAKLFGHNATHALAGYLGRLLGLRLVADLTGVPGALAFLRSTFVEESGRALSRRYGGVDPLFTPVGYAGFADDLLERMVNPFLADTIERAARDPRRKLGWDDRLIGTIRLGLEVGVQMPGYAMGAAAALVDLDSAVLAGDDAGVGAKLRSLWPADVNPQVSHAVADLVGHGMSDLGRWRVEGFDGVCLDAAGRK